MTNKAVHKQKHTKNALKQVRLAKRPTEKLSIKTHHQAHKIRPPNQEMHTNS
jgi:hypothetical protein